MMLADGWAGEDTLLAVGEVPYALGDDQDGIDLAAAIASGTASEHLPVVYISCANDDSHALSEEAIDALAFQLGGIAHVVVEPSRSFSFRLKEVCDGTNVYAGSVGIYLPRKGLVRRLFLGGYLPTRKDLFSEISKEVTRLRSLMAQSGSCDWVQLQEKHLRALRERQRNEVSSEEYSILMEAEIEAKDELIIRLQEELSAAREAQPVAASEGILDDAFVSGIGPELFEGEFSDRVRLALVESVRNERNNGLDKRSLAVYQAMLQLSEFSGRASALENEIGAACKDAKRISRELPSVLQKLGYERKSEKKHIRMEAREEIIGLESVTIPKTPGERRGLKNQKSQISNTLGLKRLRDSRL